MGILDKLSRQLREKLDMELEEIARQGKAPTTPIAKKVSLPKIQTDQVIAEARAEALRIKTEAEKAALEIQRQSLAKEAEIDEIKKKELAKLEKIASLTKDEAKNLLLEATEKRISEDIAKKLRDAESEVKTHADEKAKEILLEAMQRGVIDYVAEYTVSTVHLPDEDMKGRIIGREGRNIRAFERATGVEIELDEGNDIHLSSFDAVRREIAKRALEKLVKDRRIQPSRIEELVAKTRQELDKVLFEEGEKLCHSLKVYRLHPDLIKLLGRFKFRFSYGQNMIAHTLEETKIGVQLAYDLGADVNVVRLSCLLHDVGKVMTEEEGTHVQLGVDLAKKYRLPKEIIDCIAEHHEDKAFSSAESRIVWLADAISGSRPGARYEPHGEYVERMSQIEEIAKGFDGVEEAFAYQAGRDVRVLVKPEKVTDDELVILASKIAKDLEEKASYAGQIKVTCIRELRASETTKAK